MQHTAQPSHLNSLRLESARLELLACSAEFSALAYHPAHELEAAVGCPIAADWLDDEARFLIGYYADWVVADRRQLGWGLWLLREKAHNRIIGSAGFKGRPDWNGMIELGYGIAPSFRRQGYASEAAHRLVEWAFTQPQVRSISAECLPDNLASRRVLEGLGMVGVGHEGEYDRWLLQR